MPVQTSYPGVYIQEVSSGVRTITGVSTSIAAFFGRTLKGPINKAVRCISYSAFLRNFGGPHPLNDLGASVNQFFANGGTDCYVVRLAHFAGMTGNAASVTLKNLASINVLTFTAKEPGLWGQDLKLEVDYNTPNPDDTFNLAILQDSGGTILSREDFNNLSMNPNSPRFAPTFLTQSSKLVDVALDSGLTTAFIATNTRAGYSESRRPIVAADAAALVTAFEALIATKGAFIMNVNGTQDVEIDLTGQTLTLPVVSPAIYTVADVETAIADLINKPLATAVPGGQIKCTFDTITGPADTQVLRITSDFGDLSSVRIRSAAANDWARPMMFGLDQGGIEVARFSNLRPAFTGSVFVGGTGFRDFTDKINAFAGLLQTDINSIQISGNTVSPSPTLTTAGTRNFDAPAGSFDGVREKLRIIARAVTADPNVPAKAELWGYHLALRKTQGSINDLLTVATSPSAILGAGFIHNVQQYSLGITGTSPFQDPTLNVGGSDGTGKLDDGDYAGDPVQHTGFYALDKVDLFNLMVLPGDRDIDQSTYLKIIGPASIYCNQHRAFLLIDAPDSWTKVDVPVADASDVNSLRSLVVKDHSAVFYPKVQYSDAGLKKLIGPSGIVAGVMARTDSQRGVWKAPAGTDAALLGILDLELNLTDQENGVLNKLGVNCLRKFPVGMVNWGSRTLDGSDDIGSEWKYIPIRRLALFLEESLYRGTKWVVFEPNDEPLWAKIRMNITAFMMRLFRQGAFQGSTPDKAFFVKCDGETTTANDRNLGIVNIQVGFAPLKPAEFVIITIQQIPDV